MMVKKGRTMCSHRPDKNIIQTGIFLLFTHNFGYNLKKYRFL